MRAIFSGLLLLSLTSIPANAQISNRDACEVGESLGKLIGSLFGARTNNSSVCGTFSTPLVSYPPQGPIASPQTIFQQPIPTPVYVQQPLPVFVQHSISPQLQNEILIQRALNKFRPGRPVF